MNKNLLSAISALLLSFSAFAQIPVLSLTEVGNGFTRVTTLANCGDDRLFILEKNGVIKFIRPYVGPASTTFMDINSKVINPSGASDERGLLGIAFDPNYANNGRFYVNYINNSGNTVIAKYTVTAGNPNTGNVNSEEIILTITQPFSNHNGGCIQFGKDGFLYIGMGDGGSGGDPGNRAQNPQDLLGKMLRIDVSGPTGYTIPASNPFVSPGDGVLDEIWALGLRNPWRWSFDNLTGDMWIADVGQELFEEVNFQSFSSEGGENYGWRRFEANNVFNSGTTITVNPNNVVFPVFNYGHTASNGCSITGGYVYRGFLNNSVYGRYFTTDYCSGRIWTVFPNGSGGFTSNNHGQFISFQYTTFGLDMYGEQYIAEQGGRISRISVNSDNPTALLSANGSLSICPGENVRLSTGYHPNLSYTWYKNDVVIANADSNIFEATEAGNYYVQVTSANGSDTSEVLTVNLAVIPEVTASSSFSQLCDDAAFAVPLNGSPEGGVFSGTGVVENNFDPFPLTAGTYSLTYSFTTADGCVAPPVDFSIIINPLPTVTISGLDTAYCTTATATALVFTPEGGTLSGTGQIGIVNNEFNPAISGEGTFNLNYTFADENGCVNVASATTLVESCMSIIDASAVNLSILPNPSTGIFNVQFEKEMAFDRVEVIDATGKLYFTLQNFNGTNLMIDLNDQAKGIYILKMMASNRETTQKLINQ
jgi:glucose/arabinose dehydrogenase